MPEDPIANAAALGHIFIGLADLEPTARARRVRGLVDEVKTALAAVGDAAIVEALQTSTYAELAATLGVSASAINKAVSRHRARTKGK